MAIRIRSHNYIRLKACQKEVKSLLSRVSNNGQFSLDDTDDLLVYWRISDMTHRGDTIKTIAKTLNLSPATIHNRRKHGAYEASRIIIPLVKRCEGNMTEVAISLVPIFVRSTVECDRFVKNFFVDYQHDTGSSVPLAELIKIDL